jgi:NAD(P)-dependent dehydrogenase (short-subunit alcohol dehydrogenase family)
MGSDVGLEGRVIIVAGAGGGGIGSATTLTLARAGAHVAAIDRSEEAFGAIREELGKFGHPHSIEHVDLAEDGAAAEVVARIEGELGPVAGLVNVVGGFENMDQLGSLLDQGAETTFGRLLDFNLGPTLAMSIAAARSMQQRGQLGSIVQITSSTGIVSMPFGAGYAAAKAALISLTKTMAVEWGPAGIRVNAVACGTIMSAEARRWAEGVEEAARDVVPLGRCGEPEEIASAVLFLLSDLASYVSGTVLSVDGGALARAPYNDRDNLPVFITDANLRRRLTGRAKSS